MNRKFHKWYDTLLEPWRFLLLLLLALPGIVIMSFGSTSTILLIGLTYLALLLISRMSYIHPLF